MIEFSTEEIEFLLSYEEARLATCHDNIPHVKPVSYIYHQNTILICTDYETRSFQNIRENSNTSVVVDLYKPGGHKAICFQGKSFIIEKGKEFDEIYHLFYKKFKWVREDPWKEGEAPFLKIIPKNKKSWGI